MESKRTPSALERNRARIDARLAVIRARELGRRPRGTRTEKCGWCGAWLTDPGRFCGAACADEAAANEAYRATHAAALPR